jgi:hypothetical protein
MNSIFAVLAGIGAGIGVESLHNPCITFLVAFSVTFTVNAILNIFI